MIESYRCQRETTSIFTFNNVQRYPIDKLFCEQMAGLLSLSDTANLLFLSTKIIGENKSIYATIFSSIILTKILNKKVTYLTSSQS